jgi:ABC-type antimicrobial peptide transport system permease subunit
MSYFGMFIGVILKLIIVSLFMVSAIMMNNMLTMTVSQRQFEMAVYKTIGANRLFVILVVLLDSLKYVLVANLIAFPFAYTILTFAGDMFQSFFGFKYDIYPTFEAIFGGLFIGILVPIISSLSPIASILNNKLVEHLNPIRNKT